MEEDVGGGGAAAAELKVDERLNVNITKGTRSLEVYCCVRILLFKGCLC